MPVPGAVLAQHQSCVPGQNPTAVPERLGSDFRRAGAGTEHSSDFSRYTLYGTSSTSCLQRQEIQGPFDLLPPATGKTGTATTAPLTYLSVPLCERGSKRAAVVPRTFLDVPSRCELARHVRLSVGVSRTGAQSPAWEKQEDKKTRWRRLGVCFNHRLLHNFSYALPGDIIPLPWPSQMMKGQCLGRPWLFRRHGAFIYPMSALVLHWQDVFERGSRHLL